MESGGTSIHPATATLKYGHDAQVASEKRGNVKKGGNKGERVYGMFLALAKKGVITQDDLRKIGKDDIPNTIDTRYRQHVINCLEMTEFALQGDGGEGRANITILAEANEETREVVDAAIALETACLNKLFECEETTAELNTRLKKNFLGVGDRIKKYKKRIHDTKKELDLPRDKEACKEKLIDISELKQLQKDASPPIHPAFDGFARVKKKQKTSDTSE